MSESSSSFAVEVVFNGLSQALTYRLDEPFEAVDVGAQVLVELGKRKAQGWVVNKLAMGNVELPRLDSQLSFLSEPSLKPVLEAHPAFEASQIELFKWMADYYGTSISDVISCAVPNKSEGRLVTMLELSPEGRELVQAKTEFEKISKRAPKQAELLTKLKDFSEPVSFSTLELDSSAFNSVQKSLEKKSLVVTSKLPTSAIFDFESELPSEAAPINTKHQDVAIETLTKSLEKNDFEAHLLFGVTGSGKTEVYLQTIKQVLELGKSALIIVPEIALTPQIVGRFIARLGCPVAVLHSQVGSTKKWSDWQALLEGKIKVAIGARSGVFAPMRNLGLIVVDEEHEQSYKQSDGVRYQGRDVAVMRAKFTKCPIVLGSATPSFESLLNVRKKRYNLIELPERATKRSLPEIEVVNLSEIKKREMPSENISPALHVELEKILNNQEQAVILYNRRGYSSYLQCDDCGEALRCPDCSVTLTFHKYKKKLNCHYCGLNLNPPELCKFCRDEKVTRVEDEADKKATRGQLNYRGGGTERVVDEIKELFPKAKLIRMDRDTTTNAYSYEHILGSMREGSADILVGTQMIAKGHDLPGVTLVGIVDADVGIHIPDFRANERIYQLITQASGRAGRGEKAGKVIVQTREPNHPTIVATATNRFKAFARYEMEYRESLGYPPHGKLLRLIISSLEQGAAQKMSRTVLLALKELDEKIDGEINILGPSPAQYEKLRGRYRWNILVKSSSANTLSSLAKSLKKWKFEAKGLPEFRLSCDIDPYDMM